MVVWRMGAMSRRRLAVLAWLALLLDPSPDLGTTPRRAAGRRSGPLLVALGCLLALWVGARVAVGGWL